MGLGSALASHPGDVGAVDSVGEGKQLAFNFERAFGVSPGELADDAGVFLRFEAAGAVEEDAAGSEQGDCALEQVELESLQAEDFLWGDAPSEFDAPPHDAGVGTWGIDEDAVEGCRGKIELRMGVYGLRIRRGGVFGVLGWLGGWSFGALGLGDVGFRRGVFLGGVFRAGSRGCGASELGLDAGDAESGAILGEELEPGFGGVEGDDVAAVSEQLGDVGGFATWGGADIEDVVTGLGFEQVDGQEGAGVLEVEAALLEGGEFVEGRVGFQAEHQVFAGPIAQEEVVIDVFVHAPAFEECAGLEAEGVDAGEDVGRLIIPFEEGAGGGLAPALAPACPEPVGVGVADGWLVGFEAFEFGAGGFAFPGVGAEEGVNEAGLFDVAELVGEVDGFVDGGVIGDAVEEEELVKAQAEKGAHAVLLGAAGGFAIDQPVEGGLLSDDTEDEFLAEAAVDGF